MRLKKAEGLFIELIKINSMDHGSGTFAQPVGFVGHITAQTLKIHVRTFFLHAMVQPLPGQPGAKLAGLMILVSRSR